MTTHEKALRAGARAWLDTTGPGTDPLEDAIAAYLSALLPEDVAGLVERLRSEVAEQRAMGEPMDGYLVEQAASLIQSQAARIAALEAALVRLTRKWMPVGHRNGLTATENMERDAVDALLNGERKG